MDGNQDNKIVSEVGNEVIKQLAETRKVPAYIMDRICKITKQGSCFVVTFNECFMPAQNFTSTGFSLNGFNIVEPLLPIAVDFVRNGLFNKIPMVYTKFHIWSIEHNAWWRSAMRGYTRIKAEAGEYLYEDAKRIVDDANKFAGDIPKEAMVRVTELNK